MEKTFDEIIMEELNTLNTSSTEEVSNEDENVDDVNTTEEAEDTTETEETEDNSSDDNPEEGENDDDTEEDGDDQPTNDDEGEFVGGTTKDANAFAKIRQEAKGYKKIVDFFDSQAKAMGFSGVDELISKTNEAAIAKSAKEQGIPVEIAKRLANLEKEVNESKERERQSVLKAKEAQLNSTIMAFVDKNKVSKEQMNTIASELANDNITVDMLMGMPQATVNRILTSYLSSNTVVQKQINKVEKAKKELPVDAGNKETPNAVEDDIDKMAKYFAGI